MALIHQHSPAVLSDEQGLSLFRTGAGLSLIIVLLFSIINIKPRSDSNLCCTCHPYRSLLLLLSAIILQFTAPLPPLLSTVEASIVERAVTKGYRPSLVDGCEQSSIAIITDNK